MLKFANITRSLLVVGSALLSFSFGIYPARAGGSGESVHVISLKMSSDTDYVLVVAPKMPNDDPYMKQCKRFEVHGTYGFLEGDRFGPIKRFLQVSNTIYNNLLTKETHLASLKHLKKFEGSDKTVNFGWMGQGFQALDDKDKCVVESRGLYLHPNDEFVFSFFHMM